jgi:hypothetical protein
MTNDGPSSAGYDGRPPGTDQGPFVALGARAGSGAAQRSGRRWPNWLRRGRMELVACVVIALGIAMMLQPFAMILFTWSFLTTLFGTVMFMIVSKFPE